jgi:hypothetical protein
MNQIHIGEFLSVECDRHETHFARVTARGSEAKKRARSLMPCKCRSQFVDDEHLDDHTLLSYMAAGLRADMSPRRPSIWTYRKCKAGILDLHVHLHRAISLRISVLCLSGDLDVENQGNGANCWRNTMPRRNRNELFDATVGWIWQEMGVIGGTAGCLMVFKMRIA